MGVLSVRTVSLGSVKNQATLFGLGLTIVETGEDGTFVDLTGDGEKCLRAAMRAGAEILAWSEKTAILREDRVRGPVSARMKP